MNRFVLAGALLLLPPAIVHATTTDLSINTASYVYDSYDPSGNAVGSTIVSGGGDGVSNGQNVGFWTATTTFTLSSALASLAITDLSADDRVVAELNGVVVGAAGIFGPGIGTFIFTPTGSQVSQAFTADGAQTITVTSPFLVGTNTLELIVNNTNNGINGGLTGGPTSLNFTGVVTGAAAPEPASWALMLIGVGGLGAAMRTRRRASAATA